MELAVHVIQRAKRCLVADRRPHGLATDHALQAQARHQPLDRAARDRKAFSPQLPPDLTRAVDAEVLLEDPLNLDLQFSVPPRTGRTLTGVDPLGDMRMVGRRGDRQHLADRLDPIRFPMIVDEAIIASLGGRAPPGQNTPMPCAESRSPVAAPGSRVPEPSSSRPSRSDPSPLATVDLRLLHPLQQRLRRAADLR